MATNISTTPGWYTSQATPSEPGFSGPIQGYNPNTSNPSVTNYLNNLYPNGNVPENPGYSGFVDANGNLLPQYQLQAQASILPQFQDMNSNNGALDYLNQYATSQGPSAWAQVAQQQNAAQTAQQMGAAGAQQNGANAGAEAMLASHGGLRQGAMQNLARAGAQNLISTKQGISNQSNQNNLGILATDDQNKLGALGTAASGNQAQANAWAQVAGQQQQYQTGVDQSNIQSLMTNNQNQNAFNSSAYNANLQAWGAKQQADAQSANGGGSLWITGKINEWMPWTPGQRKSIRQLIKLGLKHEPELTRFYIRQQVVDGGLKQKMENARFDFRSLRPFVTQVIDLIDAKKGQVAIKLYVTELLRLCRQFDVHVASGLNVHRHVTETFPAYAG